MWNRFKEMGFNLGAIGAFLALLVAFILIELTGIFYVAEGNYLILYGEMALVTIMIIWGIERIIKDW